MINITLSELKDLDIENLGDWPMPIKISGAALAFILTIILGWQYDIKDLQKDLNQTEQAEKDLRFSFERKQQKAANLPALKKQLTNIEETFGDLLKRLPNKSEIAELLVDISQQGLGAGLEFELFKPGEEQPEDFYIEVPIEIRVTGTYHQFGNFISGVSDLPRIVTNHNIKINRDDKDKVMILETVAKTYRYEEEIEGDSQIKE